jgi:hypothetical protein
MSNLVALGVGLVALAGHIILSTALVRSLRDQAPVLLHIVSAAAMLVVVSLIVLIFSERDVRPLWIAGSVLYGGAVALLFLFSAVYKSISLGVLCSLELGPQHRLALADIAHKLVLPRFIERIDLLVAGGLVLSTEEGYTLTARGRRAARWLRAVQRFAGITRSGLYGGEPFRL